MMSSINVHVELEFFKKFHEIKLLLDCKDNPETQEKIIDIVYKDLKKEDSVE